MFFIFAGWRSPRRARLGSLETTQTWSPIFSGRSVFLLILFSWALAHRCRFALLAVLRLCVEPSTVLAQSTKVRQRYRLAVSHHARKLLIGSALRLLPAAHACGFFSRLVRFF
jgi:hypothetical protein